MRFTWIGVAALVTLPFAGPALGAPKPARVEREKAEREKAEREKAEREKAEREKAEREKAEREKVEREKVEREKVQKVERVEGWSNGALLGRDKHGFYGLVGYPGLGVGYSRGLFDNLDVGGRFTFDYAGVGVSASEYKFALDFKWRPFDLPIGAVTLRGLPGMGFSYPSGFTVVNVSLPVELAFGLPIMPNLMLHLSVEVPLELDFWSGYGVSFTSVEFPLLFGGGGEFKIDEALSVHLQVHMGPYQRILLGAETLPYFGVDVVAGVTYRLP